MVFDLKEEGLHLRPCTAATILHFDTLREGRKTSLNAEKGVVRVQSNQLSSVES